MEKCGKSENLSYGDRSFHSPIDVFTAQLSELTIHFTHWSPLQQRALYNQDTLHHLRTISEYQNTVISTGLIGSCLCEKNHGTIPFAGGESSHLLKFIGKHAASEISWKRASASVHLAQAELMTSVFQAGDQSLNLKPGPGLTWLPWLLKDPTVVMNYIIISRYSRLYTIHSCYTWFAYIVYNHVSHTFVAYILQKSTCFFNLHIWCSTISGNITCPLSTQARHSEQWDPRWQRQRNLMNHGFMACWSNVWKMLRWWIDTNLRFSFIRSVSCIPSQV